MWRISISENIEFAKYQSSSTDYNEEEKNKKREKKVLKKSLEMKWIHQKTNPCLIKQKHPLDFFIFI